jgi:DNA-3-methyladenine glycosylase II
MSRFKPALDHLQRVDPVLSELVRRVGPCTLARSKNHFLTLIEAIVWQQLSWHAACAIHERLLQAVGTRKPQPKDVLDTPLRKLMKAGLSRQKSIYVREVALFFENDRFPKKLGTLSDEQVADILMEVKGIGRWTAEMFLIFGLNREDVFPMGDLGIRKALHHYYNVALDSDASEVEAFTARWRPYRTIATWYLWKSGDAQVMGER